LNESQLPKKALVATAYQHGADALAEFKNKKVEFATEKTLKGGQKKSAQREGHEGQASRVKNFRRAGDVKNDTAGL